MYDLAPGDHAGDGETRHDRMGCRYESSTVIMGWGRQKAMSVVGPAARAVPDAFWVGVLHGSGCQRMRSAVGWTRYVVGLGALSSILMGAVLLVASVAEAVVTIVHLPRSDFGTYEVTRSLVVSAVQLADTVLIAAALVIIGIGLYGLFVDHVDRLPGWLEIDSLDDLKDKLVSVVVAVLAVTFFTHVIAWERGADVLYLGGGIGLVVLALAAYRSLHLSKKALTKVNDPSCAGTARVPPEPRHDRSGGL